MDFRGEHRSNETHASTTDSEARLLRKGPGKEVKLVFLGHALMENRHGLLMDFTVSPATGPAMPSYPPPKRRTFMPPSSRTIGPVRRGPTAATTPRTVSRTSGRGG